MTTDDIWTKVLMEIKLVNDNVIRKEVALSWIAHYITAMNTKEGDGFA